MLVRCAEKTNRVTSPTNRRRVCRLCRGQELVESSRDQNCVPARKKAKGEKEGKIKTSGNGARSKILVLDLGLQSA